MAEVQRSQMAKPDNGAAKAKPSLPQPLRLSLPDAPHEPIDDVNEYHVLIHGEKKWGKTTIATVEPDVLLVTFDPFQKALPVMQVHCPDWMHFEGYLQLLEQQAKADKFRYRRVVVDGVDIWYARCQAWACKRLGISHPSEEDWGKGWDLLKTTFANAVDRILALPCGVWFIGHSAWKEIETHVRGVKVEKLLPLMKQGAEEILVGRVDAWFAADYIDDRHVLFVKGNERIGAGHRIRGHFQTPRGRAVEQIDCGNSEKEAYAALINAFDNKQTYITLAERAEMNKPKAAAPAKK